MKASLLIVAGLAVAVSSIAPANAGKTWNNAVENSRCSGTNWPMLSTHQCHDRTSYTSYVECTKKTTEIGWRSSDAWWWCSNLGLK